MNFRKTIKIKKIKNEPTKAECFTQFTLMQKVQDIERQNRLEELKQLSYYKAK